MMNNYQNTWASMMAVVNTFKAQHPEYNFTVFDFDENVNEQEFPAGNLIGIYQYDFSEDQELMYSRLMFVVNINDTFMLKKATGELVNAVRYQTRHPFINYGNGAVIGHMVALNELAVSPVNKTTNRQFTFILQGFAFDRSASLPQP